MPARHLVDPDLLAVLDAMPALEFSREALPSMRAGMEQLAPASPTGAELEVETRRFRAPEGHDLDVTLYRPAGATGPLPGILDIHGGGYVVGSVQTSDAANRARASAVGCLVASVEYRLAPETPHPGPVEDCYAALLWLAANAKALDVDPDRLAVSGSSAGGGLAAATALVARDRGEVALAFQFLGCPMLDDRTCVTEDPHPYTGDFVWTPAANAFGWGSLLGYDAGRSGVPAYASPARAEDLGGLPPTFLYVGALDLFLEEDLAYALRLTRAGVPTELHVYPGAYHGFELSADAWMTRAAHRDGVAALRRALHPR